MRRQPRHSGTAYLVVDPYWNSLPFTVRLHAINEFNMNNSTWIENAPPEWQERFGDALGRVLAHEVWHQLWSQGNSVGETRVGAPHPNKSYDGIEEEACGDSWFKNSPTVGFRSAGRGWILDQIDQLDRAQGPEKTVSIKRRP